MTYCVGLHLNDGLVMASDSRTNAGVDYVTTFSKMHLFQPAPDRIFVLLSAGNLATTQELIHQLTKELNEPGPFGSLLHSTTFFEVANYIGAVSQKIQSNHQHALSQSGISGEVSLILGGQIRGDSPHLMLIYPQGNSIHASTQTPYLQIGENKYGKPALDRIIKPEMSLGDGARLCLVSLDATSGSNITVGPPYEVCIYRTDSFSCCERYSYSEKNPELTAIQSKWKKGLRTAFTQLPTFEWENAPIITQKKFDSHTQTPPDNTEQ